MPRSPAPRPIAPPHWSRVICTRRHGSPRRGSQQSWAPPPRRPAGAPWPAAPTRPRYSRKVRRAYLVLRVDATPPSQTSLGVRPSLSSPGRGSSQCSRDAACPPRRGARTRAPCPPLVSSGASDARVTARRSARAAPRG